MNKKPIIALVMGDAAGIGPELLSYAFSNKNICSSVNLIGIGDVEVMQSSLKCIGADMEIKIIKSPHEGNFNESVINFIDMHSLGKEYFAIGKVDARTGKAAVEYTRKAVSLAMAKKIDAIVSAPVNKESMHLAGYKYPGQTELIADLAGVKRFGMVLLFGAIKLFYLTNHVSLDEALKNVKKEKILSQLEFIRDGLKIFGIDSPRVAVAGLNPHAGEGGKMGREEVEEIIPAIEEAKLKGIHAEGPFPADTIFLRGQKGEYDAILVMYHDQGNIAIKLLNFGLGVTLIAGLPFIRTSVAHGTAYDIAGKGIAKPDTFFEAIKIAISLAEKKLYGGVDKHGRYKNTNK